VIDPWDRGRPARIEGLRAGRPRSQSKKGTAVAATRIDLQRARAWFHFRMSPTFTGGCLCGGTRYLLEIAPTQLNDCHCIDCRRSSGAPFVTWGTVPRAGLKVVFGSVRKVPHANRIRSFAACCGTQLFFEDSADAETVDVTIASLDDPTPFVPTFAIWTEDRLPWVVLDESRPAYRRRRGEI
jgi:hypothetical protein